MRAAELKDKYRDRVIKVSFGTGFIYCGKVDDGFNDLLKRADAEYVAKAEKRKVHAEQALDKSKKEIKRLPGVVDNLKAALESFKSLLEEKKKKVDSVKNKMEKAALLQEISTIRDQIYELEGDKKHEGLINLNIRRIEYYKRRKAMLERVIRSTEKYITNYQSFTERAVKEEYPSIDITDKVPVDMIVICEGIEEGKYWTVSEFDRDKERPY